MFPVKYLTLVLTIALAGCVSVSQVNGPNGRPAYSLYCGTHASACYQKAGELCPHGYQMLDHTDGMAIVPTANGSVVGGSQRTVLVECKE